MLIRTGWKAGATNCTFREELVDGVEDIAFILGFVDGFAQVCAARDTVREP